MTDTLSQICTDKREHVKARKTLVSESQLVAQAKSVSPPRGFKHALEAKIKQKQFALIAEIKKASPSKGVIREDFNPATLAKAYEQGGAACLSVLTDEPYFQGKDEYLAQARDTVKLPVLRKDFMLDPYQVVESRALGADCILLIMAALSDAQAKELHAAAASLGMDTLVEVHDGNEMERAVKLGPALLGINNRNLKTLKVDIETSRRLAPQIPQGSIGVCESGIETHADLVYLQASGFSCFLVGESLMRQTDVATATRKLLGGT
jgi:indole-3-glycerol phosphate synthase